MNRYSKIFIGVICILLVVITVGRLAKAQSLIAQADKVAEAQKAIAELITNINTGQTGNVIMSSTTTPTFGCVNGYTSWPSSSTPSMAHPWSNITLANYNQGNVVIRDFNGDGLTDYYWRNNTPSVCLYLNNGKGFDLAYHCVKSGNIYYGDCAASS